MTTTILAGPLQLIPNLLKLMRPKQWKKNAFVLTGLLFGPSWSAFVLMQNALMAFAAFSFASSAVYIFNDYNDREKDRRHPVKCKRPLASGAIQPWQAFTLLFLLIATSLGLASMLSAAAVGIVLSYMLINTFYSLSLKHVVILDVFCISSGFILRMLLGIIAVQAAPSNWFLLCGMGLTLFLGFAKRYSELARAESLATETRAVLEKYSLPFVKEMMQLCAGSTIIFYALYTTSPQTIALYNTESLIITVPFVIYGFMRYSYLVFTFNEGEDPSSAVTKDKHVLVTVLAWLVVTAWIIK